MQLHGSRRLERRVRRAAGWCGRATACKTCISSISDTAPRRRATLPMDMYSAAPLLVVDVTYTFQPMFFTIHYWQHRDGADVLYFSAHGLHERLGQYSPSGQATRPRFALATPRQPQADPT